jgi:lysophospholipase L1-like esterase
MKRIPSFTFILASLFLSVLALHASTEIPLSDPNIRYIGRWDKSSPDTYHSYWSNAYLRTKFTGTSVKIKLTSYESVLVSIGGEAPRIVSGGGGALLLNPQPLSAGEHTLFVGAPGQNEEVVTQGLVLDDGASTVAPQERPLIEFIGDSITMGAYSYAPDTAGIMGCDRAQIAFSARALTTGYGCSEDKTGMDQEYFRLKGFNHLKDSPQPDWDFSYTPNLIVINLGQNDQCGQEPQQIMYKSYKDFIGKLRAKFPTTPIVAVRPFSGAFGKLIKSAVDELTAAGDTHLYFVDTTGWLEAGDFFDGTHPHFYGAMKAAHRMSTELAPILSSAK